jgi:hypothetical protein
LHGSGEERHTVSIDPQPTATSRPSIDGETIDRIIELACRAPSVHNTQPWRWRVRDSRVDLYADFSRQLVYADPGRRDLLISCGAAVHHFVAAAAALGWHAKVRRAPDAADERFLASIALQPRPAPGDVPQVIEAILARRTDRRHFGSWPVPDERLASLAEVGRGRGALLIPVVDEMVRARLVSLTHRADEIQRRKPAYLRELTASLTYWADQGVPVGHVPSEAVMADEQAFNQRFPHGVLSDPSDEDAPSAEGVLLLCTSSDDVVSRLRAGEALSAVWLQATLDGMLLVPHSQALEVEQTRRELQEDVLDDTACAQLVLRVGWPPSARKPLAATPRRDLEDVRQRDLGERSPRAT